MKLYTEEQVRKLLKYLTLSSPSVDGYMDRLTPIELPSDEEIVESSEKGYVKIDGNRILNWINGAKWMKEQILNQNK
jgi:hypothetical protein